MHCRGSRAHTHIQQPMIKLLIGFMLCFFHVFLIPALPSARAQLPATFVLPPGAAFQAFGVGLLGSRLPVLSSALCTVPLKAQHPWVPALQRSCIPAGLLLGVCPSLPAVLQCCCACWLWGCCLIWLCSAACAGSEPALSPELHMLYMVPYFGSKHKMGGHSFLRGRFSAFLKVVMCSSWWCFVFSWITKLSLPQWYYYYSFLP